MSELLHDVYLAGSLRNPIIPDIGNYLRTMGLTVFDDWFAGGKIADDEWQAYEQRRGRDYTVALNGYVAMHIFEFDKFHLDRSRSIVLVLPAGKSGHLELGYMVGTGKPGYVLLDQLPERFEVMYLFANGIYLKAEPIAHAILNKLGREVPNYAIHQAGNTE